jgi:DNA-binding MarR family transcriptional regulator
MSVSHRPGSPRVADASDDHAATASGGTLPRAAPSGGDGEQEATVTLPGGHLPDSLVDSLDRAFRRLRKSMIRSPAGQVPVPALGRPLDKARIFACDAVDELAQTNPTVTVKDVASTLDLEHSTVSRLLSEIEDDGLITRGVHPFDRRRTTVALTELGHAVVADATSMSRFFTRALLAEWSEADVEELARLMTRLSETVHVRLELVPALAMEQFHQARTPEEPGLQVSGPPHTPGPATPPAPHAR